MSLLLANALNFAGNFPDSMAHLEIHAKMLDSSAEESDLVTIKGESLFILALKWYETAVKKASKRDIVYFQMAENQFQRFQKYHAASEEDGVEVIESAITFIKMAINENPNRWQYWNLYGLILSCDEVGEPGTAEEMFSVGLELDKQSYTLWANLGTLYLKCNEIGAANKAFGKAQQNDIGYVNGWIGQALIAEHLSADDEAMDLFRHCLDLGYHKLAMGGYSKWVIHRMNFMHIKKYKYAIEDMFAVPMCLDAISWYMDEENSNASVDSLSYLGYLCYHKGLFRTSAEAYLKASEKALGDTLDDISYNLGYILLILEKPEQAIKAFRNIQKTTLEAQIGLAVAHFKGKAGGFNLFDQKSALTINILFTLQQGTMRSHTPSTKRR